MIDIEISGDCTNYHHLCNAIAKDNNVRKSGKTFYRQTGDNYGVYITPLQAADETAARKFMEKIHDHKRHGYTHNCECSFHPKIG